MSLTKQKNLAALEPLFVVPTKLTPAQARRGRELCNSNEFLRDLMTVMEHPEFRSFFEKYFMSKNLRYTLWICKMYSLLDLKLKKLFPYPEDTYLGWHKIFFLYHYVLREPKLLHFFRKEQIEEDWVVVCDPINKIVANT